MLAEIKIIVAENANAIETNAIDIKVNAGKNKDTLGSIEVVSSQVIKIEGQLKELQEGSGVINKIIDGCIVGIDNNMTAIKNVSDVVIENRKLINKNTDNIVINNDSIIKNTRKVKLNSVQTNTNSDNIRMLRK